MTPQRSGGRLTILDLVLLIAGASVGLWLMAGIPHQSADNAEKVLVPFIFILGGLSMVGPPVLLWQRQRDRKRLGAGELLWFCQGTVSWLLWPPIVVLRIQGEAGSEATATFCFFYGTPMMALFVMIGLLAGGWLRRGRRRPRSGREILGLLLGLAWACTGLYILSVIYRDDLR